MFVKFLECRSTWNTEAFTENELVTYPIFEAEYTTTPKGGKIRLKEFIHESEDSSKLLT